MKLFDGTVPSNKKLYEGTVSSNKKWYDGTVPSNKKLYDGTPKRGIKGGLIWEGIDGKQREGMGGAG